jgi:eukaryotic-like serine/threonine-protein kinase
MDAPLRPRRRKDRRAAPRLSARPAGLGYDARIAARTKQDPLVGTTLEGRFRVDRVVGSGGFGVVYAAHHLTLDVPVAVKALRPRPDLSAEHRALVLSRFAEEAQIMARLRHPHIVGVLDFGVLEGQPSGPMPWLVLEWCEGEPLEADLRRRRASEGAPVPLRSVEEAWRIARPLVEAVAYACTRGVIHRDLKPSNVMLVPGPNGASPRVLDFGIAKRVEVDETSGTGDTLTGTATPLFTPAYAAPEQIAGARTGPWTDVHALGLLLTELLTDQPPYPKGSAPLAAIDPDRPTPLRFGRDVGALEAVLARAVSLRPGERYADAGALLEAIEAALRGGPVDRPAPVALPRTSTPAPPSERAFDMTAPDDKTLQSGIAAARPAAGGARPPWRRRTALALASAAAALVVAGVGMATRTISPTPRPAASDTPPSEGAMLARPAEPSAPVVTPASAASGAHGGAAAEAASPRDVDAAPAASATAAPKPVRKPPHRSRPAPTHASPSAPKPTVARPPALY